MSWQWWLSPSAEEEIEAQLRWYEEDEEQGGVDLSIRWLDRLEKALEAIAVSPERHRPAPEDGRWMPHHTIRQVVFRPWRARPGWRILYTVDSLARRVTILQIRHERRRFLFEGDDD